MSYIIPSEKVCQDLMKTASDKHPCYRAAIWMITHHDYLIEQIALRAYITRDEDHVWFNFSQAVRDLRTGNLILPAAEQAIVYTAASIAVGTLTNLDRLVSLEANTRPMVVEALGIFLGLNVTVHDPINP